MEESINFIIERAEEGEQELQLKESYKKLYESEKYFRSIIESSFNGIAVTDEQGNFEFVNESFLKMIDWPREEIIGQNFMKIIPEDIHEFQ